MQPGTIRLNTQIDIAAVLTRFVDKNYSNLKSEGLYLEAVPLANGEVFDCWIHFGPDPVIRLIYEKYPDNKAEARMEVFNGRKIPGIYDLLEKELNGISNNQTIAGLEIARPKTYRGKRTVWLRVQEAKKLVDEADFTLDTAIDEINKKYKYKKPELTSRKYNYWENRPDPKGG